jgi:acetoin utilization deacetylase AcuC-like enzyme
VAARVDAIRASLEAAGTEFLPSHTYPEEVLHQVHEPDLVDFLRTAWNRWETSGYLDEPGQNRVVPYAFPLAGLTSGRPPRRAAKVGALAGMYCMDTMTLIGPGTWEGARAAAFAAITAAELAAETQRSYYAACRPPGHHAGPNFYGGSCYLNNAALAAARLAAAGLGAVTVIDLDAHHGNGTQEIFYRRGDVRYGSVHVDPALGWFPHYVGFADEAGEADGRGANLNLPIAPGAGDRVWLEAVEELVGFSSGCGALVISLGVDAAADDPESPLMVSRGGYRQAGNLVGAAGLPMAIVQEGGYDLATLGSLVTAFLSGVEEAAG